MEFAIGADEAVTRNDQRHWVGCVGAANCAKRERLSDLRGDARVGAGLAVRDGKNSFQRVPLKVGGKNRPINCEFKVAALAIQIFLDLIHDVINMIWRIFDVAFGLLTDVRFKNFLRDTIFNCDQSMLGDCRPDFSERSGLDASE